MVTLYYGSSSKTGRQSLAWFEDLEIEVTKKKIERITRPDLVHILTLSENGFSDVLKRSTGRRLHISEVRNHVNQSSFEEAIDYLLKNMDVLKVPIIFDERKLLIGYNTESIRMFIPKGHRKAERFPKRI